LAVLVSELRSGARSRVARRVAGARSGVRHPRRHVRRIAAAAAAVHSRAGAGARKIRGPRRHDRRTLPGTQPVRRSALARGQAPPQVVFTAPVANDTDVEVAAPVRIQFSRDMQAATFRDRVRVAYTGNAPAGAPASPPQFTVNYNEGTRALEIKFAFRLDRFR